VEVSVAKRTTRKQASTGKTAKRKAVKRASTQQASARKTGAKKRGTAARKPSALGAAATAVRGTVAGAVAAFKKTASNRPPDAINLLETDHRRMEDLLKRGEGTTERAVRQRTKLLDDISAELATHELLEEQVLYPALEEHPEARAIALEGFQEHHVADLIVDELHHVAADNEQWGAKFKVLKENIEHHIDEEEGEMFRTARAVLSQDELKAMGVRMTAMKTEARRSR
jgi:hypothetical protein